ncbi:MAG: PAS domain S-box protein [Desulfovibrionaceae bacterium]|jgi:PAS domain S-box-containing protein|nr:PAS domain S-box protein [Desulfovibrionaceae bacterium]
MDALGACTEYLAFFQGCLLTAAGAFARRMARDTGNGVRHWLPLTAFLLLAAAAAFLRTTALAAPRLAAQADLATVLACCALGAVAATRVRPGAAALMAGPVLFVAYALLLFAGLSQTTILVGLGPLTAVAAAAALLFPPAPAPTPPAPGPDSGAPLSFPARLPQAAPPGPFLWRVCCALLILAVGLLPAVRHFLPAAWAAAPGAGATGAGPAAEDAALAGLLLYGALPALLAAAAAATLGGSMDRRVLRVEGVRMPHRHGASLGVLLYAALLAAGAFLPLTTGALIHDLLERQLRMRVQAAGRALAPEWVAALTGSPGQERTPIHRRLLAQLSAIRLANPDLRFVYLAASRLGEPVILLDTEPANSPDYAAPGELYAEAPHALRAALKGSRTVLTAPYTDRWGTWISGFTPIADEAGRTFAVLGMDIDARAFTRAVGGARLLATGLALLASLLVPAFFTVSRRRLRLTATTGLLREVSEARARALAGQMRSEEQYRTLVEKADDGMALVREGVVLYANPRFAAMAAIDPGEMVGRAIRDFVPAYRGADPTAPGGTDGAGGPDEPASGAAYEARVRNPAGGDPLVELRSSPVTYRNRVADLVTLRDVTRQRRNEQLLREAEAKFALVFTHHPLSMLLYETATGLVVDANPAALALYGYNREELLGKPFAEIAAPSGGAAAVPDSDHSTRAGVSIEWHAGKNRVPFPVEASAGRFNLAGREVACVIVRSAQRRVEAARSEREARGLAQGEARRYRRLMRAMGGCLERQADPLEGHAGASLRLAAENLAILSETARLAAKQVCFAPDASVREALDRMYPIAHGSGVTMDLDPIAPSDVVEVLGAPSLVTLALVNLVHAALRAPGCLAVRAGLHVDATGRRVIYTVRHTGGGIPSHRLTAVLEIDPRDGCAETDRPGGLSLAMARLLTEPIGGALRVESRGRGTGATFVLQVPYMPVCGSAEDAAQEAAQEAAQGAAPVAARNVAQGTKSEEAKDMEPKNEAAEAASRTRNAGDELRQSGADAPAGTAVGPDARTVPTSDPDADLRLWDRKGILQRLDIDEEFLGELCVMFHASAPGLMDGTERALAEGDEAEAARRAHALKNECMNVGSDLCRDLCEAVVRAGRMGDLAAARAAAPALREALDRLVALLPGRK